jgi:hypothetical protein
LLVKGHQAAHERSPENLPPLAEGVFRDILDLKAARQAPGERACADLLQLYLSVALIDFGNTSGRLQISHDWIVHGLCDRIPYGPEEEFQVQRLVALANLRGLFPICTLREKVTVRRPN